jgi:hypothetical protein
LSGFILLLLINADLFFREVTYLKSNNSRESIDVERVFLDDSLLKLNITTSGDGSNLIFEIVVNFDEIFNHETNSLHVSGTYFIGSPMGPNRSGKYSDEDALKRVLNIFRFHFSK